MSTRTSSLSMRTTSPSTMSPSLKSMRTLSSMGTISPFSSRKKSFIVSSRVVFSVVSVMYLVAFLFLSLPVQIIQFYGGLVGGVIGRDRYPLYRLAKTLNINSAQQRRFSLSGTEYTLHLSPALAGFDLGLQRRVQIVGGDHPVGG